MIVEVRVEVVKETLSDELEFWRCLGFARLQRTRAMGPDDLLRSRVGIGWSPAWIRLVKVPGAPFRLLSLCSLVLVAPEGVDKVLADFERSRVRFHALMPDEYWGVKRVEFESPSGHSVSVLDRLPPVKWPGS